MPIKVVHIGMSDSGGAGMGMMRLHRSLCSAGHDSRVLVAVQNGNDDRTCEVKVSGGAVIRNVIPAVFNKLHLYENRRYKNERIRCELLAAGCPIFTNQFSLYDDLHRHPWIVETDVVHLHWVAGFVNTATFFSRIAKPIVWTLRDENPLLGGFHYSATIPADLPTEYLNYENELAKIKSDYINKCKNLSFVALSSEIRPLIETSPLGSGHRVVTLPNSVSDYASKHVFSKTEARKRLGFPEDRFIVLFVSQRLDEKRKGLEMLRRTVFSAIHPLGCPVILAVGAQGPCVANGQDIIFPGFISEDEEMALLYSAADVYVSASVSEGCCKSLLDALAYGIPVVTLPHSGAADAVNDQNGVIATGFDETSLLQALSVFQGRTYDKAHIRCDALQRFSSEEIASRHLALYTEILTHL